MTDLVSVICDVICFVSPEWVAVCMREVLLIGDVDPGKTDCNNSSRSRDNIDLVKSAHAGSHLP